MVGGNGRNQFGQYAGRSQGIRIGATIVDDWVILLGIAQSDQGEGVLLIFRQASTSGTQSDKAPIYDSEGTVEVHHPKNCYDNDIFNMFTQEE
nr:hypothetical protein [Tanacetum cinerariifolium]